MPDIEKEMEAYKTQLHTDTYTLFAAGLNEDIQKLVLGVPNPPTEIMGLHAAARNAEREIKKSKPSSSINEVSEEMTDTAPPPVPPAVTGIATVDLADVGNDPEPLSICHIPNHKIRSTTLVAPNARDKIESYESPNI